jgi:hypothetical protein
VLVLAGCGSQAKTVEVKRKVPESPRKVLLASVQATTAAKTARMSMSMEAGIGGASFAVSGEGITNFTNGDSSLTMKYAAPRVLSGGAIEIRVVDGDGYMKMPEFLGEIFGSDKWFKMPDVGDANSAVPGLGQSDPSEFLAYLEGVSAGVKKVGSEPIRGVDTTHYSASIDLRKAVARADAPQSLRDEIKDLFGNSDGPAATIPADVWVDDDGLARRIKLQLDFGDIAPADAEAGDLPTMTISMDLYDFGVPVHVEAPPADEVTEFPFPLGATGSTGADGAAA